MRSLEGLEGEREGGLKTLEDMGVGGGQDGQGRGEKTSSACQAPETEPPMGGS